MTNVEMAVGGLQHLAKDVKLTLLVRAIADSHGSGVSVSPEVIQYLLVERILKINIIENLCFRSTLVTYAKQPFHEPVGFFPMSKVGKSIYC